MDSIIPALRQCTISNRKRSKHRIPFLINGTMQVMKTVTKSTTCNDIINKLKHLSGPLAVFESADGVERELPGKTKLLTVIRCHDPASHVTFSVKKTESSVHNKRRTLFQVNVSKRDKSNLSVTERNVTKRDSKSKSADQGLSKDRLKRVSDLAVYARFQKAKILALRTNQKLGMTEAVQLTSGTGMARFGSSTSVSSMDAFLSRVNLEEMAQLMNFCNEVSVKFLERQAKERSDGLNSNDTTLECVLDSTEKEVCANAKTSDVETDLAKSKFIDMNKVKESLETKKLGLKAKFATIGKVKSTTSVRSNDTGYHSVGSKEDKETEQTDGGNNRVSANSPSSVPFNIDRFRKLPRHSTPCGDLRNIGHWSDSDATLTSDNVEQYTRYGGKSIVFNKFMMDHPFEASSSAVLQTTNSSSADSRRVLNKSTTHRDQPVFNSQKEKCQFYWNSYCDSDSDSSGCQSDTSCDALYHLDKAFVETSNNQDLFTDTCSSEKLLVGSIRTLRRESAVSNLQKHTIYRQSNVSDLQKSLMNPLQPTGNDAPSEFDYSIDCSFPLMDDCQTTNFSCNSSDTDSLDLYRTCLVENDYDLDTDDKSDSSADADLDSFMRTRSSVSTSATGYDVTVPERCRSTSHINATSCTLPLLQSNRFMLLTDEIHI